MVQIESDKNNFWKKLFGFLKEVSKFWNKKGNERKLLIFSDPPRAAAS